MFAIFPFKGSRFLSPTGDNLFYPFRKELQQTMLYALSRLYGIWSVSTSFIVSNLIFVYELNSEFEYLEKVVLFFGTS